MSLPHTVGEYHQFDGIVLPEPKSWFGLKALKYFTNSQDSLDKNFYYYQEKSLLHYLDDMKDILINCGLSQKFGIHSATEKTLYLFNQLFLSKVQVLQRRQRERVPIHVRIAKQLPEVYYNIIPLLLRLYCLFFVYNNYLSRYVTTHLCNTGSLCVSHLNNM